MHTALFAVVCSRAHRTRPLLSWGLSPVSSAVLAPAAGAGAWLARLQPPCSDTNVRSCAALRTCCSNAGLGLPVVTSPESRETSRSRFLSLQAPRPPGSGFCPEAAVAGLLSALGRADGERPSCCAAPVSVCPGPAQTLSASRRLCGRPDVRVTAVYLSGPGRLSCPGRGPLLASDAVRRSVFILLVTRPRHPGMSPALTVRPWSVCFTRRPRHARSRSLVWPRADF